MLYEALSQPKAFLILFIFGFLTAFMFDFIRLLCYFFKNINPIKQIFYFICMMLSIFIFTECNLNFNFGDVRFFAFLAFWGALLLQRATVGKFLANFMERCYNFLNNFGRKVLKKVRWKKKEKEKS